MLGKKINVNTLPSTKKKVNEKLHFKVDKEIFLDSRINFYNQNIEKILNSLIRIVHIDETQGLKLCSEKKNFILLAIQFIKKVIVYA